MLIRLADNKYPATFEDVGADHPTKSIPPDLPDADLRPLGYAVVQTIIAPAIDPDTQTVSEITPLQVDGVYQQNWQVTDLSASEQADIAAAKTNQARLILVNAVQTHIDSIAQAQGYDSGLSCISYATGSHPTFSAEAVVFRDWRDAVWTYCHAVEADVAAGTVAQPTATELITGLPVIVWPG